MKTMLTTTLALSLCLAVGACADRAEPQPTSQTAAASQAERITGTFAFVLDASDVATTLRARCDGDSGGDVDRARACFDEIRAEAATEKIRFSRDAAGTMVWRSFGVKEGKEELFLEVPVELSPSGPQHVEAKIAGTPVGPQTASFPPGGVMPTMRVEIIDATTIAMIDPRKGRLVFSRE